MESAGLEGYVPASFGGAKNTTSVEAQIEQARRPGFEPRSPQKAPSADSDASDSDDSDDEDEFPISHGLVFKTHDKAVTSITLDTAGARMVTGSTDCTLKFHDFASLAPNTIRAFKALDPYETTSSANSETHPIHQVTFDHSGSQILTVTAHPQTKVFDRNGELVYETVKGDMYLRDMNMTKGHTSEVTSAAWHPYDNSCFVTAGTDSTLRIWDMNVSSKQRAVIVHKSKQAGNAGRSRMTAVAWGSEVESQNNHIVSAALDGSLLMWPGDGPYHRPTGIIQDAHKPDTWTSGIDISAEGRLVVTKGGDDTIKLWDIRKFKNAVSTTTFSSAAQHPRSNIIFAPNSSSILTGSADGSLHILNPATLKPQVVTAVTPGSPLITVTWHPKLNQIFTGSANGETHVLFSPKTSSKGALSILSRPPKRHHVDDNTTLTTDQSSNFGMSGEAVTQNGVSAFTSRPSNIGLTASGKSRDPRRPHIPHQTPFGNKGPDEDHINKSVPFSDMRNEDPREALLRYADKAKDDPMFTKAWSKTQPKTIYDAESDAEESTNKKQKR